MSALRSRRGALRHCLASTGRARARYFLSSPGCSACKPDVSAFSATISDASRARRYAAWGLVVEQGIGVLWATHLFDEIVPSDDLVILHQGRILAEGKVAGIVAKAKARDLHSAFAQLTENGLGSEDAVP